MKKIALIAILAIGALFGNAQNLKFAHIDSQKLLEIYPGRDSAEAVFNKEVQDAQTMLEEMQVELNKKYEKYLQEKDTLGASIRTMKEQELQDLQARVQNYQVTLQESLQQTEAKLLQPILEAARATIEKVAKENGYIYVFDTSGGQLLYHSEKSTDLLDLVTDSNSYTQTYALTDM